MDNKKDESREQTEKSKSSSSKKPDELNDDQLDFSGGVAAIAACTKCNQSPCVCSNVV